jgi:putative membrane protein
LIEYYDYFKALHLIFIITWFAGLFYIPRLFIYIIEAQKKSEIEKKILTIQFNIMTKRLWYIITWPSAILAILFAVILILLIPAWLTQQWMVLKIVFAGFVLIFHIKTHLMYVDFKNARYNYKYTFRFTFFACDHNNNRSEMRSHSCNRFVPYLHLHVT